MTASRPSSSVIQKRLITSRTEFPITSKISRGISCATFRLINDKCLAFHTAAEQCSLIIALSPGGSVSLFIQLRSKSHEATVRSHTTCCAFLALSFYIMTGALCMRHGQRWKLLSHRAFQLSLSDIERKIRRLRGNTVNGVNPIALPRTMALTGVHDNNFPSERIGDDIMKHVKAIASLTTARTRVFSLEASNVNNCAIKCTQTQCTSLSASAQRDEIFFVEQRLAEVWN